MGTVHGTRAVAERAATLFFICVGCLLLAQDGPTSPAFGSVAIAVIAGSLAGVAWLVPWTRLPRHASLGLAVGALGLLVLVEILTDFASQRLSAAVFPIWIILVLVWVGLTQPRATVRWVALSSVAALGYTLARRPDPVIPILAAPVIVIAGTVLGEGIARLVNSMRRMSEVADSRNGDLERIDRFMARLEHARTTQDRAELLRDTSLRLLAADYAEVDLWDEDGSVVTVRSVGRTSATSAPLVELALRSGDLAVGTMRLALREPEIDGYAAQLRVLFANRVGAALGHARELSTLNRAARSDALTGTGNRRHADHLLSKIAPGDAVFLVDLDNLKEINDSGGHRAGDEVLRRLGSYLSSAVRGSDEVARYGGDEFLVVAAETDPAAMSKRLLEGWRAHGTSATISIGAAIHRIGSEPRHTLDRADIALYSAKASGRNRSAVDDS